MDRETAVDGGKQLESRLAQTICQLYAKWPLDTEHVSIMIFSVGQEPWNVIKPANGLGPEKVVVTSGGLHRLEQLLLHTCVLLAFLLPARSKCQCWGHSVRYCCKLSCHPAWEATHTPH